MHLFRDSSPPFSLLRDLVSREDRNLTAKETPEFRGNDLYNIFLLIRRLVLVLGWGARTGARLVACLDCSIGRRRRCSA